MPKLDFARRPLLLPILASSCLILLPSYRCSAQELWNVSTGDWSNAANWNPQTLPTSSTSAYIENGGTVTVSTSGDAANGLYIGEPSGTGTLLITSGGSLSTAYAEIGISGEGYGTGSATVNGGNWNDNTGVFAVGFGGYGTLTFTSGTITSGDFDVANGGTGTVNMSGGTWNANEASTTATIGDGGTAVFNLSGGTVNTWNTALGYLSNGTATITGGAFNSAAYLYVGGYSGSGNSTGTMTVNNGSISDYVGYIGAGAAGSSGNVTIGSGGSWSSSYSLYVGFTVGSTGTVTLDGNGSLSILTTYSTAQLMTLGNVSGSQGTLQIGNNDAYTGTLGIKAVTGGAGTANLILDQTNSFNLSFSLTGSLSLHQNGSGTTTLSSLANGNTYTGGTTIAAGKLLVNTAAGTGTGAVEVQSSGAIGGTGSITGALTIDGGGTLAPGSATFTANGGISLLSSSTIAFTLGTTSDRVTDNGSLSLGQNITLSLTPGTGFSLGTYTLINFTGTLADNSSSFSGWTLTGLPGQYTANFSVTGSSLKLNVVSVPEANSSAALALGLAICLGQLRRRRGAHRA